MLLDFAGNLKTTLVVVTHDRSLARLGDRTLEILDGQMIAEEMDAGG